VTRVPNFLPDDLTLSLGPNLANADTWPSRSMVRSRIYDLMKRTLPVIVSGDILIVPKEPSEVTLCK